MEDARNLRVLLYHHVHDGPDGAFRVTPAKLRRQMEQLIRNWYAPITLDRLLAARQGGDLPANAVLITFDDAYEDVFVHARPILAELEIPAAVFVIADAVGGTNTWDGDMPRHRHMNAEQLRQLVREGWGIGSHSRTHPILTQLSDGSLDDELGGSKDVLEEMLGVPVRAFAYPGGHRDARVKAATARRYEMGFSTDVFGPYPAGDAYDVSRFDPSFCRDADELARALEESAVACPRLQPREIDADLHQTY